MKQAVDSAGSTVGHLRRRRLSPYRPAPIATPDERRLRTTEMGILIKTPARRREGPGAPLSRRSTDSGESADALHIREVVRITGLRREQLYMWQRRYGFPAPLRDTVRRSRVSARPGRAPAPHQAIAVRRLARRRGRARSPTRRCNRCSASRSRSRCRCRSKSKRRSGCCRRTGRPSCRTIFPSCSRARGCAGSSSRR